MKLSDFSDAQIITLYHQVNISEDTFKSSLGSEANKERITGLYDVTAHAIYDVVRDECTRRGIYPMDCVVRRVVEYVVS